MAAYDCFETAVEALLGKAGDVFIRLQDRELLIMADAGEFRGTATLSGLPLPVRQSCEDGQLIMRFDLGGEAA